MEDTDEMNWRRFYTGSLDDLKQGDRFYHGTRADLRPGDLIKPAIARFWRPGSGTTYVYFSATSRRASGCGVGPRRRPRPDLHRRAHRTVTDDPNLRTRDIREIRTRSYRSRDPLRSRARSPNGKAIHPKSFST